jgi:hypothetical protein
MTDQADLIVQLPLGGAADQNLRADPPPSVRTGRVVVDQVAPGSDGRLAPSETGEVILSVLSPETLAREPERVRNVLRGAPALDEPLLIIVEAAEELREDELTVVADAAAKTRRRVILRVMSDS